MTNKDARRNEIQAMHGIFNAMNDSGTIDSASQIALLIRTTLLGLSKSPRWDASVNAWALLVQSNADCINWAYNQGSIDFGYMVQGLI